MIKNFLLSFLLLSLFYSCKDYENKDRYEVQIGEKVEIYYSTNSCCYYCLSNEKSLKYIKLKETKTIDDGPSNCDGCNYVKAFVFEAISAGIDTVELKLLVATADCDSNNVIPEKYIIEVKN